jgi:diguanylate cyclase (GGDEF)-like protein
MIDAQTGILNRRGFFKTIEEKQSHLTNLKMKFTVYTFMLHPLKEINENYGYDLGNELITFSVLSLLRSKQEHDTIARISGNQFVIYSKSEAQFVLSFYNDLLENAFSQMDTYIAIDVQIKPIFAIASSPNDGKTIDEIMSIATKRMNKQVKA